MARPSFEARAKGRPGRLRAGYTCADMYRESISTNISRPRMSVCFTYNFSSEAMVDLVQTLSQNNRKAVRSKFTSWVTVLEKSCKTRTKPKKKTQQNHGNNKICLTNKLRQDLENKLWGVELLKHWTKLGRQTKNQQLHSKTLRNTFIHAQCTYQLGCVDRRAWA